MGRMPLQLCQPWRKSFGPQRLSGFSGQFSCAAQQAVQDQRPLDVVVQLVLGGEADTAEHLLAVACGWSALPGRLRPWPAATPGRRGRLACAAVCSVASAPSIATSVSASRCRIA